MSGPMGFPPTPDVVLPCRRWPDCKDEDPLLLLHGFLGRADDWAGVVEALAPDRGSGFRLGAVDLPGHGAAVGLPDAAYTMDGAADALADAIDWYLGEAATVVGYSMGGRLALHLALRHPERVLRLVLLSASPGLATEEERAARRALDAGRAAEIADDFAGFLVRWYRQPLFGSLDDGVRARLVADRQAHNDPAEVRRALAGMGAGMQPSLWEQLPALRVPAWALAGEHDPKFVGLAGRMAVAGPIRPVILPGVGHAIPAEAPAGLAWLLRGLLA